MNLKKIQEADIKDKKVFLRVDADVPIQDGKIDDFTRLKAWFPTLEYLLKYQNTIIIAGHLGRPNGKDEKLSLRPIAEWIRKELQLHSDLKEAQIGDFEGWQLTANVFVLENLRFYPEEEQNDDEFSKKLSQLAEIYVNDAFASTHRAHASIVGITKYLPSFAGLRLQKEVEELSKVINSPKRPLTIIIGGAKIETKLPLVEKMHAFADFVLVGGEIAEHDRELVKVAHEKLASKKSILLVADLTPDTKDITEYSTQNFTQIIQNSKTVVWNGPMGLVEDCFDLGTRDVAKAIANSGAYTIVGGGDTVSFLNKDDLLSKFSFVSIGGGAMLEFLAGEKLSGLKPLEQV